MKKSLIVSIILASVIFSGCAKIVKSPAFDEVHKVALVSAYMNKDFYNSDKTKDSSSLLGVLAKGVVKKATDKINIPLEYLDEKKEILAYGMDRFITKMNLIEDLQLIPITKFSYDAKAEEEAYRKKTASTSKVSNWILNTLVDGVKSEVVVAENYFYVPISGVVAKTEGAQEVVDNLAKLCNKLHVDAVAIVEFDMSYTYGKSGKIALFGQLMALANPIVKYRVLMVNSYGEIAVDTKVLPKKGFKGESCTMVNLGQVSLTPKNGSIERYKQLIDKASNDMLKRLNKAIDKLYK
jgi:hypothetical protein